MQETSNIFYHFSRSWKFTVQMVSYVFSLLFCQRKQPYNKVLTLYTQFFFLLTLMYPQTSLLHAMKWLLTDLPTYKYLICGSLIRVLNFRQENKNIICQRTQEIKHYMHVCTISVEMCERISWLVTFSFYHLERCYTLQLFILYFNFGCKNVISFLEEHITPGLNLNIWNALSCIVETVTS